jgi:hypothetical protein
VVFHVELRQFPHLARRFNLNRDQLGERILTPWLNGESIELDDREFSPERGRIAIYEGRALATDEIGMGRGWSNATRTGEEVTERLLAEWRQRVRTPPALEQLKRELLDRCGDGEIGLWEIVELAEPREPGRRASERLSLAEQAVWELLHEGKLELLREGLLTPEAQWQEVLLEWSSWSPEAGVLVAET